MPEITQQYRSVSIGTPLGEDVLLLKSMSGTEQLGRLFAFNLQLASTNPDIKFEDLMGQNVTVRMELPGSGERRYFNGLISRFTLTSATGELSQYSATMVPWLWFLTRAADCRIFQEKTVPDIIKEVFLDYGFSDLKDSLGATYRTWDYCVQYRENCFNFVSRLMEQEGIYYYFEHEDGKHTLVLADGPVAHVPCPDYEEIPFRPHGAEGGPDECISDWSLDKQVLSGAFAHRDFDFKKPKTTLEAASNLLREHGMGEFEVFDFPGEFPDSGEGDKYASIRMQELQSAHEVVRGVSNARGILPGGTFTLKEHTREDQNREYLVTQIQHRIVSDQFGSGSGTGGAPLYQCAFRGIPNVENYRSPRTTPKPQIAGPQTAMVTGPKGEEIHTDEHGRVKVQFHWDRDGQYDDKSSCWVRVSQNWAGKRWGAFFLPRIGQEVIVEFLEGDPDRPIITGRIYNGDAKPPYELPGEKTKSTLKSNSSPGGEGFNELRFEDKKGEEQIFLHGQKNWDVRILNDHFEWIGSNQHVIVENDKLSHIKNNRHETVDADHVEKVGKDLHLDVKGKEAKKVGDSLSLTVTGDVVEVFKANHSEKATGNYYLKAMGGVVIESLSGITLKCGANAVVIDNAGVTIKGAPAVTIEGTITKINSGPGSPAKAGSAGSAVSPTGPGSPEEADVADPGEVEEIKQQQKITRKGKYGAAKVAPFKPPPEEEEKEKSWIEIELVDEEDNPVPGEKYRVELPDGTVAEGTLDGKGFARVEGFDPGECKVTFPDLDKEAWEKA